MTEKNLLIGVVMFLVVAAGAIGLYSKFKDSASSAVASPSPNAEDVLFGNQNQTQQQKPGQQAQAQKTMKQYPKFPGILAEAELQNKKAVIQTTKGVIEFEIFPDAPNAASNFIFLTSDGFYNGLTFHRVEPGFVIQGGDPAGNGTGGPGYKFEDEPVTMDYSKGIVAMANAGPDTNGSQFFIMLDDHPELPKNYTIFGKVISGQEVVDKIVKGDVMQKVTIENNQ
jgi:cyclophilin family peptidyl-prolyl cis-trans isomerase